jgi:hypothetical protein
VDDHTGLGAEPLQYGTQALGSFRVIGPGIVLDTARVGVDGNAHEDGSGH